MRRILFIMHSMPTGGAERVLIDIMNHIDYSQYEVHLLLRDRDGGLLDSIPPNVRVIALHGRVRVDLFSRIYKRILNTIGFIDWQEKKRTRILVDEKYNCIISFCQGPAHKLHQYLLNYSSNHVSWVHSDLLKGNWGVGSFENNLQYQEDAYNRMNQIVFVSEGAKKSFNKLFRVRHGVIQHVVYNIVDRDNIIRLASIKEIPKPKDKFIYVNVGRLIEAKNQMLLLQASECLKEKMSAFEVWILGEGPLRDELEHYIDKHGLSDYVKLLGNKCNPYIYVKNADAFVSSSRQEGFPMVLCEAISLCKPVISTDIVGPQEVLHNGKYGIMVEETAIALCEAMYCLATDKRLVRQYEDLSAQRAKDFTTDDFMGSFYSIVENDFEF